MQGVDAANEQENENTDRIVVYLPPEGPLPHRARDLVPA